MKDVAPLQRGFDLPSDQIQMGNIPVVYSNGVQRFHSRGMVKAPGLITGRSGTIGRIHFIEEGDYWPHNTSLWVTSFNGNLPKFIYYLYKSIRITQFASGSGVPTLNRNDVHSFQAYLPSLINEQQKIADCLSSIDDRITAETQKLDTLKAHKKGLMQQLFPAEGETLPKLRFLEFQREGKWKVRQLGELLLKHPDYGVNAAAVAYSGDLPTYLRITDISDEGYYLCDKKVSVDIEAKDENYLSEGDIVFARTGASVGKSYQYRKQDGKLVFAGFLLRIRPRS